MSLHVTQLTTRNGCFQRGINSFFWIAIAAVLACTSSCSPIRSRSTSSKVGSSVTINENWAPLLQNLFAANPDAFAASLRQRLSSLELATATPQSVTLNCSIKHPYHTPYTGRVILSDWSTTHSLNCTRGAGDAQPSCTTGIQASCERSLDSGVASRLSETEQQQRCGQGETSNWIASGSAMQRPASGTRLVRNCAGNIPCISLQPGSSSLSYSYLSTNGTASQSTGNGVISAEHIIEIKAPGAPTGQLRRSVPTNGTNEVTTATLPIAPNSSCTMTISYLQESEPAEAENTEPPPAQETPVPAETESTAFQPSPEPNPLYCSALNAKAVVEHACGHIGPQDVAGSINMLGYDINAGETVVVLHKNFSVKAPGTVFRINEKPDLRLALSFDRPVTMQARAMPSGTVIPVQSQSGSSAQTPGLGLCIVTAPGGESFGKQDKQANCKKKDSNDPNTYQWKDCTLSSTYIIDVDDDANWDRSSTDGFEIEIQTDTEALLVFDQVGPQRCGDN